MIFLDKKGALTHHLKGGGKCVFLSLFLIERIEIIIIRVIKAEEKTIAKRPLLWYNIHKRYKKTMKNKKNKKHRKEAST